MIERTPLYSLDDRLIAYSCSIDCPPHMTFYRKALQSLPRFAKWPSYDRAYGIVSWIEPPMLMEIPHIL